MKPTEKIQEYSAELLIPDYGVIAEKMAAHGVDRNEQDVYFGRVKQCFPEGNEKTELYWCTDAYETEENVSAKDSKMQYRKKIICVSPVTGKTDVLSACDVEVEEIKPGSTFDYEGSCRMLPRYKAHENPYVMSLADALGLYHKYGLSEAVIDDIFIGMFSFRNFNEEDALYPDWRRHFGIGLCYMIEVVVDNVPSVAVVCAFNETRPKRVICNPLTHSVIRRYQLNDAFRTVCGRMRLINGVMKHQK